jgi:hypothetical protein
MIITDTKEFTNLDIVIAIKVHGDNCPVRFRSSLMAFLSSWISWVVSYPFFTSGEISSTEML